MVNALGFYPGLFCGAYAGFLMGQKSYLESVPIFLYQFKLVQKNWYISDCCFPAVQIVNPIVIIIALLLPIRQTTTMKKFLAFLLATVAAFGAGAQAPKEKTLLWKITGKDVQAPSYLYGTFHLLCPDDFSMPDTVQRAFRQTKQLYLEIDLDDPSMMAKMMKGITMKDGHTLKEYISEKEYDTCARIFKEKTGMPLGMMASYKPFMLTSMLYPSMIGCEPIAFEKEFEKMAKADSMDIKGLETIEDQLAVFDEVPYKAQAKMLVKSLHEMDKGKKQFNEMVALYKTKNVAALHDDVSGDTELGKYETLLLDKRNSNWIPVISRTVAEKPTFIAVGAGHLGGKNGVISLLRKQGYKVTPVMY